MFEPSMLTFNGSWRWLVIHAFLWFGSVIVAIVQRGDITSPDGTDWADDEPKRLVYMYYWLFTLLSPLLLVIYELASMGMKGYFLRVALQGFIFAFGFLGIAFGTASVQYAVAADVIPLFTFGLFLACAGMGMFITFHAEFRTTLPKAESVKGKVAADPAAAPLAENKA